MRRRWGVVCVAVCCEVVWADGDHGDGAVGGGVVEEREVECDSVWGEGECRGDDDDGVEDAVWFGGVEDVCALAEMELDGWLCDGRGRCC